MNILTNETCDRLEALLDQLGGYPGKIESAVETFDYVMNNPTIQGWVGDTENGRALKEKVAKNNASLKALADSIQDIYQITNQLVVSSRSLNNN